MRGTLPHRHREAVSSAIKRLQQSQVYEAFSTAALRSKVTLAQCSGYDLVAGAFRHDHDAGDRRGGDLYPSSICQARQIASSSLSHSTSLCLPTSQWRLDRVPIEESERAHGFIDGRDA